MRFVYLLRSAMNGAFYVGTTDNLKRRLSEHNAGKSTSTRRFMPWHLLYFEGYATDQDAYARESNLKVFGKAFGQLKRRLSHTLIADR